MIFVKPLKDSQGFQINSVRVLCWDNLITENYIGPTGKCIPHKSTYAGLTRMTLTTYANT